MDPGPLGACGVIAASRVAQDKCLAGVLALFLLSAVEDPVRVMHRRGKYATPNVVSLDDISFWFLHGKCVCFLAPQVL